MSYNDWISCSCDDLGKIVTGKTPSTKVKDNFGSKYLFITPKDLQVNKYIYETERYLSDKGVDSVRSCLIPPGSVCVSCIGNIGYVGLTTQYSVTNQQINSIIPSDKFDAGYVFYYMRYLWPYFKNLENQSTTLSILNKSHFSKVPIVAPSLPEQKAIADTLSCLDDKIELNNRMNEILEEMAQAIFKSWFVDFEPFQDGVFVDSELGPIPTGWRVGGVGELVSKAITGDWGKDCAQGNYTEEVLCIRGTDLPDLALGKKGKSPTRYILERNFDRKTLSHGDIIIEISGGGPTQSTGRTALVTEHLTTKYKKSMVCTNFCRALSPKEKFHSAFVYSMLKYLHRTGFFFLLENGTTGIKNLDINSLLYKHPVVIPNEEIMESYASDYKSFIDLIHHKGTESEELSLLRDTLLPKLMSGEIRVPFEEVCSGGQE